MRIYGEGPVSDYLRRFTDKWCFFSFLIIFLLSLIGGIVGLAKGAFQNLTMAHDSDHAACGFNLTNYPYVYFAAPQTESLWATVCVKKCPSSHQEYLQCHPNTIVKTCLQGSKIQNTTNKVQVYESVSDEYGVCQPLSNHLRQVVREAAKPQQLIPIRKMLSLWPTLLIGLGVVIFLTLSLVFCMRMAADVVPIIILFLTLGLLMLVALSLLFFPHQILGGVSRNRVAEILFGVLCLFIFALVMCIILRQPRKYLLACRIYIIATRIVESQRLFLWTPLLLMGVGLILTAFMSVLAIGIYSARRPVPKQALTWPFKSIYLPWGFKLILAFTIMLAIWVMQFMRHIARFLTAGTVVDWYYKNDAPIVRAKTRMTIFHMGSIIKGSLLSLLFGPIRLLSDIIAPNPYDTTSFSAKMKYRCCCFCMPTVNFCYHTGAYTHINIIGHGFLPASAAVNLLEYRTNTNLRKMLQMNKIVSLLARLLVVLIVIIVGCCVEKLRGQHQLVIAAICLAILAFTTSIFFISLYTDSVQALIICYVMSKDLGQDRNTPQDLQRYVLEMQKIWDRNSVV